MIDLVKILLRAECICANIETVEIDSETSVVTDVVYVKLENSSGFVKVHIIDISGRFGDRNELYFEDVDILPDNLSTVFQGPFGSVESSYHNYLYNSDTVISDIKEIVLNSETGRLIVTIGCISNVLFGFLKTA